MRFNVSGLIQEGIGATRKYQVEGAIERDGQESERVEGEVEFVRTKAGVLVRAHLTLVEPEVCSRCLKPLEELVPIEFEEEFQSTVDGRTGSPIHEPHDPDAFFIDEFHILDLTEAVRQYREVSLLMKPVCRDDCRGLCPRCGQDLNNGSCDCDVGVFDNRWSGLAALKGAASEGKE